MSAPAALGRPAGIPDGAAVIDCDVHIAPASPEALFPYLPDYWREVLSTTQFRGPTDTAYPPGAATSVRPELAGDPPAGSTLEQVQRSVLEPWRTEHAILTCLYAVESVHNPDAAAALASAVNDWQIAEWLDRDPRLRGSVVVASALPALAAAEIDRVGGHPGFVQVLLPVRSLMPYGNRNHLPTLEAAVRSGLAVGLHFGGASGNAPTSTGWPTRYVEEYVDMASVFQSQLMSLVAEGAFDRLEGLRVVLLEGGFAWLPAFLWRFDRLWRGLRREIPWATRSPSVTIREQVRLTTQPMDGPTDPAAFGRLLAQMDGDQVLLFASDYPHNQYDTADEALLPGLGEAALRRVLAGNARTFYGLEVDGDG
ncbi:MAG TPA: amidohydrolase family protein [Gaiellales bacterium]|nr:amidohydrolase family protein [Gaiellales bacterium]